MSNTLYKKIFDFDIKENMKISISNNEIYNQLILYIFFASQKNLIIICANLNDANTLYSNIKSYVSNSYLFPDDDYLTKKALASSPELMMMRMHLLSTIDNEEKKIVICDLNSFTKKLPSPSSYKKNVIYLKKNDEIDNREFIINQLTRMGYIRQTLVTNTGEFAVRGYILDVFPIEENHPIRIEFFDSSIEQIKIFDENTQLSLNSIDKVKIMPMKDEYDTNDSNILDYLFNPLMIIQDYDKILSVQKNLNEQANYYNQSEFVKSPINTTKISNKIFIDLINNFGKYDLEIIAEENKKYNENIKDFFDDIEKNKYATLYSTNLKLIEMAKNKKINTVKEYLNSGFSYNNYHYYSENDLSNLTNVNTFNFGYKYGKRISSIENLKIGDYVVHKVYGIGIYRGITTITKNSVKKDYILIKYNGQDKLYIPIDSLKKIYKYASREGVKPHVYKLNSKEWNKTKLKIKNKIKDISEELLKVYRSRKAATIEPFLADSKLQYEFEKSFQYEETADQLKATKEIKEDLESSKPMDRLLCGDVGYGKTEVIFRAIFKAVDNLNQVLYLCPTTILSFQQYQSAINRFLGYGLNIRVLNRYTSTKDKKCIIEEFKSGKIDVLFGTHRLLSDDIKSNNLGLVIIDEEQRFGVSHKEKIKKYKNNVNILSVSATPIPRSLQMSLVGIRDLSLIETPPKNRLPIQTYVLNYDELFVKEIVLKEISRNGQVFILSNNIGHMEELLKKYQSLLPNIKIRCAHGKMIKKELQDIIYSFNRREFDVLLATTIIENGIDIPNANTIIILDADRFGLSQLYQIRGRVGRSNKIAYAYLMYRKDKVLGEVAVKRLEAIKEFTELGSGYKISMRDLSIRGAGDLLGKEQSGFIDSVGVDMYLDLIKEQISNIPEDIDSNDTLLDDIETHISDEYSEEDEIIIELHQKISSIKNENDLLLVKNEIVDRFGIIKDNLDDYLYQELLENMLKEEKILVFENKANYISLRLNANEYKKVNMEELFIKSIAISPKFNFIYKNNYIIIKLNKVNIEKKYVYYLVELLKIYKKIKK